MTLAMVERHLDGGGQRQRKERSDAGTVRQTARDGQFLHWLSEMYGAPADLVRAALGIGQPRLYQLIKRWRDAQWIEKPVQVDAGPLWIFPRLHVVRDYLEWSPAHWVPKATTAAHTRAVAAVRLHEHAQHGWPAFEAGHWISERQLAHEQGYARKGQLQEHTPDGVLILPDGQRVLIEVELTAKSVERYRSKLTEIRIKAERIGCAHVAYYTKPGEVTKVVTRMVRERVEQREQVLIQQQQGGGTGGTPGPQWHVRSLEGVPGWKFEPASQAPSEGR